MGCCPEHYGKASAVKWLAGLLMAAFLLGLLSVIALSLGLVSAKAQGEGSCTPQKQKEYTGLGRWDDGPYDMHINWHVCELVPRGEPSSNKSFTTTWKKFGGSWYQAFCGWHSWQEAEHNCLLQGRQWQADAHLVSINSKEENEFVQLLCGYEACFIGLYEKENTEEWAWPDGTEVGKKGVWDSYTNWNDGEPNNFGHSDENIALMNLWYRLDMPDPSLDAGVCEGPPRVAPTGSGKWFDISRTFRVQYSICEKPMKSFGEQYATGQTCDEGWSGNLGSCYFKNCRMHDHDEAQDACRSMDADLVSINSPAENHFVRRICGLTTCRIGLSRRLRHHGEDADVPGWSWTDGKNIGEKYEWTGYVNWNDGEPDNWGGHEDAAVMNNNDVVMAIRKGFLFGKMKPVFKLWAGLLLGAPFVLLCATCVAARYHSACVASCVRTATGTASCWLGCMIALWLTMLRAVNDAWPDGSRVLLLCLAFISLCETVVCCMASARAQELQWSTTVPWSAMGARDVNVNVGEMDSGVSLSSDVRLPGPEDARATPEPSV